MAKKWVVDLLFYNNILWKAQNALFLSKTIQGSISPDPPSISVNPHVTGLPHTLNNICIYMYHLFHYK